MLWLDPSDPRVVASVLVGTWCGGITPPDPTPEEAEEVRMALEAASDLLLRLSGYLVHPAGIAEEDFVGTPRVRRLTPNYRPLRRILGLKRVLGTPLQTDEIIEDDEALYMVGSDIYFRNGSCGAWWMKVCGCLPDREVLRLCYQFGNTVTAAARRAVLYLAYQILLECRGDADCQLPERTTSIQREGLSYQIFDPQSYLTRLGTGLPLVDTWLNSVNPSKALRPSGVWTPDAPPAVNRCIKWVRPLYPAPHVAVA